MLQVKNVTVTHKKDFRVILKDVSFVLNQGDKAAIIGEEGNGKSTLMRLLYDPAMAEYVEYEGEIIRNGANIGYLMQELSRETMQKSVYEFVSEEETFYAQSPGELAGIARELVLPVELFYSEQRMGELSGGEKVKLQMARLLMGSHDMLFLDEPTNDIDLRTYEWLEKFIRRCSLPILFISHDETLLERTANKIIHLEQIRRKTLPRCTVTQTDYTEYLKRRTRQFEHQEAVAKKERSDYQKQQERFRQIYQKVEHQQNVITRQNPGGARLLKKKIHAMKSQEYRFERQAEHMTEMPEAEESIFIRLNEKIKVPNGKVILDYRLERLQAGDKLLAEDIHLRVEGPRHICIIGDNGTGKSTLLKGIAGELLARKDIKACYMPQNYEDGMDMTKTPLAFLRETGSREETCRNRTYLGSMKYTADEMLHSMDGLSGGQRAKLFLLKMSISGCDVMILDEPTRNFSPLSGPVIREMFKSYKGAIISISHDRKYVEEVCDRVYRLTPCGLEEVLPE